jgi:hypothetical protein
MDIFQKTQVQDLSIAHLIGKNDLQKKSVNCSRWYVKNLRNIVKALTNIDYLKRSQSCSIARIDLSSYKGPNWRLNNNNCLEIKDLCGYDYIFSELSNKGCNIIEAKRAKTGSRKFRAMNAIKKWDDVYKSFFEEYD